MFKCSKIHTHTHARTYMSHNAISLIFYLFKVNDGGYLCGS